jgi:hypothetical protein
MTTRTATLVEFLTAQLDEDEAAASGLHDIALCKLAIYGPADPRWGWECDCGQPARVLAEVDAKRRILELHRASTDHHADKDPYCVGCWEAGGLDGAPSHPCPTLRLLALPYADHPDYDEAWRP